MIQVRELSPVWSSISDPLVVKDMLSYKYTVWLQGPGKRKIKKEYTKRLISQKGLFYSGFQKRVLKYLGDRNLEHGFTGMNYWTEGLTVGSPTLQGIKFRPDQEQAIREIINNKRGVWKAPTGSGKTIVMCGVISAVPCTAVVIVHTETLFKQTYDELVRFFGPEAVGMVGGGVEDLDKDITVAMIQTLSKRKVDGSAWGMVIVDEAHHCSKFGGTYADVLREVHADYRVGFTATPIESEEGRLACEGLIGPVIGTTTYEELQEQAVLAVPDVWIYKVPLSDQYKELKGGYKTIYGEGVVRNRARNKLIVEVAKELLLRGHTVLVMVEIIEHGNELMKIAEILMPGEFVFLHGTTPSEIKVEEKQAFSDKDRRAVIATRIWTEGVNIRSIGAVINAVGGKSEIACIQRFGRGMRTAEGKDSVVLVDFIDTNHQYFTRHSMLRIWSYLEAGWSLRRGGKF